jgi:phosphomannomutase
VHYTPDATFPNGIPNPLLSQNHAATADVVKTVRADFGVVFDGDFDRCVLFGGAGQFVPGKYVVGLLEVLFVVKKDEIATLSVWD